MSRHYNPPGTDEADGQRSDEGIIEGKNAVIEALRANRAIDKVFISEGGGGGGGGGGGDRALGHIASSAREKGAVVVECDRRKLDSLSITGSHQGVIAIASVKEYCDIHDILDIAAERGEKPFIVICDEISDHHNLGAIIRTAEAAGIHGIIIPKRRSAGITAIVEKTSAGAANYMAVARVANISQTIKELKKAGIWVYGAAAEGEASFWQTDFSEPTAIVIGSEGGGLGRLVREQCDSIISVPMAGKTPSLNASVSAAIIMYEGMRQRLFAK